MNETGKPWRHGTGQIEARKEARLWLRAIPHSLLRTTGSPDRIESVGVAQQEEARREQDGRDPQHHRGNLHCFDYAVRNLPSTAPMVEVGSFCGLSANLVAHYKRKHGVENRLIACDKWELESAFPGTPVRESTIDHAEYRELVKDSFLRSVSLFSRELSLGGPISFCCVDGNPTCEFVKRDFQNCDEFLEPGGFILFDDSADGSGWEVCRLVGEIKKESRRGRCPESELPVPEEVRDRPTPRLPTSGNGRDAVTFTYWPQCYACPAAGGLAFDDRVRR